MLHHWGSRFILTLSLVFFALAGCSSLGGKKGHSSDTLPGGEDASSLPVNTYLWRATLETLDFMPLAQTDSSTGLILTDWYINPQYPRERFKLTVYILDKRLRADALKVNMSKQEQGQDSQWRDVKAHPDTITKIENAILTRARELRIGSAR